MAYDARPALFNPPLINARLFFRFQPVSRPRPRSRRLINNASRRPALEKASSIQTRVFFQTYVFPFQSFGSCRGRKRFNLEIAFSSTRHLHFASLESFFSHLNNVTRFFRYFTRKIEKKGRKERKGKEKER